MNKRILYLVICIAITSPAMAQIPLVSYIHTNGSAKYPTHIDSLGYGGFRVVKDITERNAITTLRRKYGMAVYVQSNDSLYILRDAALGNANWFAFTPSGSAPDLSGYARVSDTATMLSPYLLKYFGLKYSDTASMLSGYTRNNLPVKYTDTATMLSAYRAGLNALNADTATIQPRLNNIISVIPSITGKVNISDTAAMLSPYGRTANTTKYADTSSMLAAYRNNISSLIADTATIQPRLNNIISVIPSISGKLNISDTAAMIAPYVRKNSSSIVKYNSNYGSTFDNRTLVDKGYVDSVKSTISNGSVTSVSIVTANGVSGSVATASTTPAITLSLGAITPASVAATGSVTGSNLSGNNTGNVTIGTANGLSIAGQVLSMAAANGSTTGALTAADWTTFNNKANTGAYLPSAGGTLTGGLVGTTANFTGAITQNSNQVLHAGNYNSYAPTLTGGSASGTWGIGITGNAATATTFSTNRSTYKGVTDATVAGQLMWKNYGNGHTIFDASAGTAPDGTAHNNSVPETAWAPTYPTLMGYNGGQTYGVKVNRADLADLATSASSATSATRLSGPAQTNGTDGWFRSNGAAGWYSNDYGVGIYATEAGNVRTYNGANFITSGNISAGGADITGYANASNGDATVSAKSYGIVGGIAVKGDGSGWLGVLGVANWWDNLANWVNTDCWGVGGAFIGDRYGVNAWATSSNYGTAAIKAYNSATGGNVYVNYLSDGEYGSAGTVYKIHGIGSMGTVVKDLDNKTVSLHSVETPEIYFQDFGESRLDSGFKHITLDPILAKNIVVNSKHPLRVFIQPYGECEGVYVTNVTPEGFDVYELRKGKSNVTFQWQIVGNRKDDVAPNGRLMPFQDIRFDAFK